MESDATSPNATGRFSLQQDPRDIDRSLRDLMATVKRRLAKSHLSAGGKCSRLAQNVPGPGIESTRTGRRIIKDEPGAASGKGMANKAVEKDGKAIKPKAASGAEPIARKRKPNDLPQARLMNKRREGWENYLTEQVAQATAGKENNTENRKNENPLYIQKGPQCATLILCLQVNHETSRLA